MYRDIEALKNTIVLLCEKRGITLNKLATLSGVTQSTLDSIMKGKSRNPKLETLRKISVGLEIDYNEFVMYLNSAQDEIKQEPIEDNAYSNETSMRIVNRIRYLRNSQGKTLIDIYKATGLDWNIESLARYNVVEDLIALADFFDVSLDYLTGRSDNPARR